jgi:hypothetical protein
VARPTVIDPQARRFDGRLKAWIPHDVIHRAFTILQVLGHCYATVSLIPSLGKRVLLRDVFA